MNPKTYPMLIPPPPAPPFGRVAAASDDEAPRPRKQLSFWDSVRLELAQFVWPAPRQIIAATLVTMGLIGGLCAYVFLLNGAIVFVLRAVGLPLH